MNKYYPNQFAKDYLAVDQLELTPGSFRRNIMDYDWYEIGRQQFDGKRKEYDFAPIKAAVLELFNDDLDIRNRDLNRPAYKYYVDKHDELKKVLQKRKRNI